MGEGHELDGLEQILVEPALSQQRTRAEAAKAENSYWKLTHSNVEIVSVETSQSAAQPDKLGVDLNSPDASPAADSSPADSC